MAPAGLPAGPPAPRIAASAQTDELAPLLAATEFAPPQAAHELTDGSGR
ncbi:hypothetical protein [Roseomonas sp. 18066]|nr:hypothetical protein [Roseomonas sp. 18066]